MLSCELLQLVQPTVNDKNIVVIKRFFLTIMMLLLPMQPLIAAGAEFAHLVGSQPSEAKVVEHIKEHANNIAHHHEQDGQSHEDESPQSMLHMLDCEHACNSFAVLAPDTVVELIQVQSVKPAYLPATYLSPPTSPPIKPPYAFL